MPSRICRSPGGGYLAVDLFFVLSGFVLMHAYEPRILQGMRLRDFMRIRLIRLYPLYLLGSGIGLAFATLTALSGKALPAPLSIGIAGLFSALMLPSPTPGTWWELFPLDPPAWSLFLEVIVNALFVLLLPRLSMGRMALLVACSMALLAATISWNGSADVGAVWSSPLGGVPRVMFSFFAGALMYRFVGHRQPRKSRWAWLVLLSLVPALSLGGANRAVLDAAIVFVIGPLIVAALACVEPPDTRVLRWLGTMSYPLYMIHLPILARIQGALRAAHVDTRGERVWLEIAILTGLLVLALALDRFYDRPARRWLSRVTQRRCAA